MAYRMKPVAKTAITVLIKGEISHDHGDGGIDVFIMEFASAIDFAAWLEFATKAMHEKEYIALDHWNYHTYEMIPHEIVLAGNIKRKFKRIYPPRAVK